MTLSTTIAPYRAVSLAALIITAPTAAAFDFGNMMNPSRWFGGNDDYYYNEYGRYAPGYVPYAPPGYPPPNPSAYYPAFTVVAPPVAPQSNAAPAAPAIDPKTQEIDALKRRIEQLESAAIQQRPSSMVTSPAESAPAPAVELLPAPAVAPPEVRPQHRFRPLERE